MRLSAPSCPAMTDSRWRSSTGVWGRPSLHWAALPRRRWGALVALLVCTTVLLALQLWRTHAQLQGCLHQLAGQPRQRHTGDSPEPSALRDARTPGAQLLASRQQPAGHHPRILLAVFTGFTPPGAKDPKYFYERRRAALLQTWFPATRAERDRWEAELGIAVRFVIGRSPRAAAEAALRSEIAAQGGGFMRLPLEEDYEALPNKTLSFLVAAAEEFPSVEWVIKVDDDVYIVTHRLLQAVGQWERMGAEYIGCMKHGDVWTKPGTRWFEPHHLILGRHYFLHAYGSVYALRARVVADVVVRNADTLRLLANEDTTVGLWMLSHRVTHFEDMRMCSPRCTAAAVGILDNGCAGLCHPLTDLLEIHEDPVCRQATPDPLPYHHSYPEHTAFERMWVA